MSMSAPTMISPQMETASLWLSLMARDTRMVDSTHDEERSLVLVVSATRTDHFASPPRKRS